MDFRVVLVCLVLMVLAGQEAVRADFLYNRVSPKQDDLDILGLECIPGRTVIKVVEKVEEKQPEVKSSGEDTRRSHMRFSTDDEYCQMCVCSAEGKDEYCSKRPAMNVNECIRMSTITKQFPLSNFDSNRVLAYRIRRDYIWHKGEIPYDPKSKCYRGHTYYSNSPNANDTDIEINSDVKSVLNYPDKNVCYFCVCSVKGEAAGCINRNPWYCNYFRHLKDKNAQRDRYRHLFQQDRSAYFRLLSFRLRRTMDNGMFDLIETGGDSLCCGHPNGHRRHIHHQVKNKIRLLKNRVNKENLMGGPAGGDYVDFIVNNDKKRKLGQDKKQVQNCVPFVSVYSDCNEENICEGCSKCTCSAKGTWTCTDVRQCKEQQEENEDAEFNDDDMDVAVAEMIERFNQQRIYDVKMSDTPNVPKPSEFDRFLDEKELSSKSSESTQDDEIFQIMTRNKRSVDGKPNKVNNQTVISHHAVDEINEDTLQNSNVSGTITAKKFDVIPSRRSTLENNSTSNKDNKALQIEFTPPITNQHASDNKIDTTALHDDHLDLLVHHKLYEMAGNESQATRDNKLSKLVVNELKGGSEIIGDKESQVLSNITFTPENDTMTAMAFIAGNLLNKIWNMEKEASENSLETDSMKHKKINDLLELFKEPLNLRQETFLKNALEHLATTMDKKEADNITICKKIEDLKKSSPFTAEPPLSHEEKDNKKKDYDSKNNSKKDQQHTLSTTADALSKISNALELIKKYESVQNTLSDVKLDPGIMRIAADYTNPIKKDFTKDENTTFNVFGNILKKLTKLLVPNKKGKKMVKRLKDQTILSSDYAFEDKIKSLNILNITDIEGTVKDRIVLDYLIHMQSNPDCLINKKNNKPLLPSIEGDILLNLSEFLKIKSMSNLLKLIDSEKIVEEVALRRVTTLQTSKPKEHYTTEKYIHTTTKEHDNMTQFKATKEKLKMHLKTILEDLVELQNMTGKRTKGENIEISNALPCIFNLLNDKTEFNSYSSTQAIVKKENPIKVDPVSKLNEILKNLKTELKRTSSSRRSNFGNLPRPKSAIVWERTIKNVGADLNSRRHIVRDVPKSREEIKKLIEHIESTDSNTYKGIAFLDVVPTAERLLLLKTLAGDTKKYINALKDIQKTLETVSEFPSEDLISIDEFMNNVNLNINLNAKILKKLQKSPKVTSSYLSNPEERIREDAKRFTEILDFESTTKEVESKPKEMSVSLTKDQIINQLMKNRLNYYIKSKTDAGVESSNINVALAKQIIFYMDIGNVTLAREMFKMFIEQKSKKSNKADTDPNTETVNRYTANRRLANKVPLIQFDEPKPAKKTSWSNQDQLIKQLINIKNMRI